MRQLPFLDIGHIILHPDFGVHRESRRTHKGASKHHRKPSYTDAPLRPRFGVSRRTARVSKRTNTGLSNHTKKIHRGILTPDFCLLTSVLPYRTVIRNE